MIKYSGVLSTIAAFMLLSISLYAQSPIVPADSVVRSSTAAASGTYTASSLVMIKNRARVLGDRTSASGTRYFAVTDSDLIGKKPDEVLQRLSPTRIAADDQVRDMEVLVDLKQPITLYNKPDQQVNIGTTTVQGSEVRKVDVHANIFVTDLTVVTK